MFLNIPGALRVASAHHLVALRCRIWPMDLGDLWMSRNGIWTSSANGCCRKKRWQPWKISVQHWRRRGHAIQEAPWKKRTGAARHRANFGRMVFRCWIMLVTVGHFGLRLATDCFGLNESAHMFNKTFWALEYRLVLLILEEKLLQKRLTSKRRTAIVVRRATWHCGQTSCRKWQLRVAGLCFSSCFFMKDATWIINQDVQYVELLGTIFGWSLFIRICKKHRFTWCWRCLLNLDPLPRMRSTPCGNCNASLMMPKAVWNASDETLPTTEAGASTCLRCRSQEMNCRIAKYSNCNSKRYRKIDLYRFASARPTLALSQCSANFGMVSPQLPGLARAIQSQKRMRLRSR